MVLQEKEPKAYDLKENKLNKAEYHYIILNNYFYKIIYILYKGPIWYKNIKISYSILFNLFSLKSNGLK